MQFKQDVLVYYGHDDADAHISDRAILFIWLAKIHNFYLTVVIAGLA